MDISDDGEPTYYGEVEIHEYGVCPLLELNSVDVHDHSADSTPH